MVVEMWVATSRIGLTEEPDSGTMILKVDNSAMELATPVQEHSQAQPRTGTL